MKLSSGLALAAALWSASLAAAQSPAAQTGSLEFSARVTPAGGRAEAVLRFPFVILRKSFADIQKEAAAAEPVPDLDKFIEAQPFSPELKAWMKRTHSIELTGDDFMKLLSAKDISGVPEFFDAYLSQNAGDTAVGFPKQKIKERDRTENPARVEQAMKEYHETIRKYLQANPHTKEGMDIYLAPIDPARKWTRLQSERRTRVRNRSFELAGSRYLLLRVETDLEGRAAIQNVPAGDYWISTLEAEASGGDVRLRWDLPVTVQPGRATRVELSNINSARPDAPR